MSKEERWKNVSGKFSITEINKLIDTHVLLVDDVVTTGSTIEACGEELLKVPGLKLSLAVLAKA
jgi:predicted amidophosphoribosyltransferase